jgi:hypothetical protein
MKLFGSHEVKQVGWPVWLSRHTGHQLLSQPIIGPNGWIVTYCGKCNEMYVNGPRGPEERR